VAAKTRSSGTTTESNVAKIFLDLREDAVMSSLDDRSITRRMAIKAPPTPPLITVVIDTALVAAVVVAAIIKLMHKVQIVDNI